MSEVDTTTLAELATQRQAESIFTTLLDQRTFINCTYVLHVARNRHRPSRADTRAAT